MSECGWSLLCPAKLNSHLNEALGHLTSTHSPKAQVTQHTTCFQSSSNHCAVGGSSKQSWYFLSAVWVPSQGFKRPRFYFTWCLRSFKTTLCPPWRLTVLPVQPVTTQTQRCHCQGPAPTL